MPTITIPYKPRPYQIEVHNSDSRFRVCVFHRQAGKSTMAINELVKKASLTPNQVFWYLAPTYKMAKRDVWKAPDGLFKYLPKEIVASKNEVELSVTLKNGSIIMLLGADNPDTLRGARPRGIVCDEYGDMKEEVWDKILRPIMTVHQEAWCLFIGTPKGRNHFYTLFKRGEEKEGNWQSWILKASQSGVISKEALDEAQRESTEAAFRQEYECDFLDNATAVFRNLEQKIHYDTVTSETNRFYQMGVDLAKYNDFTVLSIIDLHSMRADIIDRFNQVDYAIQKPRIESVYFKFNRPKTYIDSTGVGDPITEDLLNKGLNVEPYKFNESSRRALLTNLAMLLDQCKITIPNNPILLEELKNFKYDVTSGGRVTMTVPNGLHDDCVMSLALACWGVNNPLPIPQDGYQSNVMNIPFNYD